MIEVSEEKVISADRLTDEAKEELQAAYLDGRPLMLNGIRCEVIECELSRGYAIIRRLPDEFAKHNFR